MKISVLVLLLSASLFLDYYMSKHMNIPSDKNMADSTVKNVERGGFGRKNMRHEESPLLGF